MQSVLRPQAGTPPGYGRRLRTAAQTSPAHTQLIVPRLHRCTVRKDAPSPHTVRCCLAAEISSALLLRFLFLKRFPWNGLERR